MQLKRSRAVEARWSAKSGARAAACPCEHHEQQQQLARVPVAEAPSVPTASELDASPDNVAGIELLYNALVRDFKPPESRCAKADSKSKTKSKLESKALQSLERYTENLKMFNSMATQVSANAIAANLNEARGTIQQHMRLMSALLVLSKRFRNLASITRVESELRQFAAQNGLTFEALQLFIKDKYDHVSLTCNLTEERADKEEGVEEQGRPAVTKLLQTMAEHHCMWQIGERFVTLRMRAPTSLVPCESTSAECTSAALRRQLGNVKWASEYFTFTGRVTCADEASSNLGADCDIYDRMPFLRPLRFICKLHKKHKTGRICFNNFAEDRTGLLHSTLPFKFDGGFRRFRQALRYLIRTRLKVIVSDSGPGAQANYRESRNQSFASLSQHRG